MALAPIKNGSHFIPTLSRSLPVLLTLKVSERLANFRKVVFGYGYQKEPAVLGWPPARYSMASRTGITSSNWLTENWIKDK